MQDSEAFISKGFKSTAAMAIKVKLKTKPNHLRFLQKILRIIIKKIFKKSNSFWFKFKSELQIAKLPNQGHYIFGKVKDDSRDVGDFMLVTIFWGVGDKITILVTSFEC